MPDFFEALWALLPRDRFSGLGYTSYAKLACCQDHCNISKWRSLQKNVNHPLPIPVDFFSCYVRVFDNILKQLTKILCFSFKKDLHFFPLALKLIVSQDNAGWKLSALLRLTLLSFLVDLLGSIQQIKWLNSHSNNAFCMFAGSVNIL